MKDAYDYKVLQNTDADALAKEVVKSFREGWEPIGGVALSTARLDQGGHQGHNGPKVLIYAQALVKR